MVIGFTCGAFDLLHAGHIIMLRESSALCDRLLVGLQTDPSIDRPNKNKPIQSIYERYVQLSALKYVYRIIPYDTENSLRDVLTTEPIHVRFLGEDHRDKPFTGDDLDIKIIYTQRDHSFSSSELRKRIENSC